MAKVPSTTANEILSLLQSLTKANADSVLHNLSQFIKLGTEKSIVLLKACFDNLNRHKTEPKNPPLEKVVASIFRNLLVRPNFCTVLRKSLRESKISHGTIENFSDALHLSLPEKICIGLALSNSENFDIRICGKNFYVARIEELCAADPDNPNSREQILSIISFFQQSECLSGLLDSFLKILSFVQLKDDIFTEILDICQEK
ncbi:hypothetical protein L484_010131 [Morus notabilis]|uniref:Uncharacterized protein n=1 Tax=Morus notabilis TaxID=981085 RepID=W9QC74_9ROSA|nr:uncharacterized protein LOC21393436 [Morus notabilis]EXB25263.1 hypothetical protein L484_010131 [Morus notabilis]